MTTENDIFDYEYNHYNDYAFKSILLNRANGLLKFAEIPYKIKRMMISEVTNLGPSISRLDFVGEAEKEGNSISLILECQTKLPTDEDIKRFFQYVSSIRIFKDSNVELFILCVEKPTYTKKEFVIKEDCVYTMHVISLKDFKAKDIFKKLENKLKNNQEITDEDIASLQLIVYTDFEESKLEILNKARKLFEDISDRLQLNINEKTAIIYLFDVLSANMLDSSQYDEYVEENKMLLNPVERYMKEKGIEEGMEKGMEKGIEEGKLEDARRMLDKGFSLDVVVDVTGLSREVILDRI
ncbi:Rpn family recombination-promoting nuclease/putative transposase [Methanobrevibacter sp.]|uniref:Rpn family recombination-promoting nuclease/putative transposase n=1 Tax=Methanobrevibacter sp. TaxID=66852 RepID=UPI0039760C0F